MAFQPSNSNFAPDQVTDVLYRSLESVLTKRCARRYDAGMVLRRDRVSSDGTKMRVHVCCRGLARMPVRVVVTPVGGTVYDVLCAVEDGGSRRFSYSRPGEEGVRLSYAPGLGEKVATFLLGELEKRLGRMLLRAPTRPPRPTSLTHRSNREDSS